MLGRRKGTAATCGSPVTEYKNECFPGNGVPPGVVGQPVGVYQGRYPNPHVLRGQEDMENAPVTFNRIGTRWGDVQLKNGWWQTNWGRRIRYAGAGFLVTVTPTIPGQTRLSGGPTTTPYVMRGPAPSQWDQMVQAGPGMQPQFPGGPGQMQGVRLVNPGSGG